MRNIFLVLLLSAITVISRSQVVMNLQLPPLGLTVKSQLWNLSLVNPNNYTIKGQIEILVTNVYNNQPVFSATSRLLFFPQGITYVTANKAAPVLYNNISPGYNIDLSQEGFLPLGVYNVCYTFLLNEADPPTRMAEICETVEIEPLSPPVLIFPADSAKLDYNRPLFGWLPPLPVQLFNNLNYDFSLVEVGSLQTGAEALQENIPLHAQSGIVNTTLQYPLSLPDLELTKLYAWKISARSGGAIVAHSDVWTFRLIENEAQKDSTRAAYYVQLKAQADVEFTLVNNILRFSVLNESSDSVFHAKLWDISNAIKTPVELEEAEVVLHFGMNYREVDFSTNNDLVDKHLYLFELSNNQKRWYIKFQFRN